MVGLTMTALVLASAAQAGPGEDLRACAGGAPGLPEAACVDVDPDAQGPPTGATCLPAPLPAAGACYGVGGVLQPTPPGPCPPGAAFQGYITAILPNGQAVTTAVCVFS